MGKRACRYCQKAFLPSKFQPAQAACSDPGCQRRRRNDYHRRKVATDPVYRQGCRDSAQQWRAEHPGYWKQLREHFALADCRVFVYYRCRVFAEWLEMRQQKTLRERIEARIARKQGEDVFLPREFRDLGGEDQVLRVLRGMVREKRLVRLGYGVYGRAVVSRLSGEPILYSPNGFLGAARQALTKLGVAWESTEAERAYNEGRSTQVPVNPVVRVKGRFSRRLRDGNRELVLER